MFEGVGKVEGGQYVFGEVGRRCTCITIKCFPVSNVPATTGASSIILLWCTTVCYRVNSHYWNIILQVVRNTGAFYYTPVHNIIWMLRVFRGRNVVDLLGAMQWCFSSSVRLPSGGASRLFGWLSRSFQMSRHHIGWISVQVNRDHSTTSKKLRVCVDQRQLRSMILFKRLLGNMTSILIIYSI